MARVYAYVLIAAAMIIILPFFGIETAANQIADILGITSGELTFSSFFNSLFSSTIGILTTIGLAGLTIGLLKTGQLENFVILGFIIGPLVALGGTFYSIYSLFNTGLYPLWIKVPVLGFFGAFIVGYVISMVEYFRGNI